MEEQAVASPIPEKLADASATPVQKESNNPYKAYVRNLQPVTEDDLALYGIIEEEMLNAVGIDSRYLLDIPMSFHNDMHEDIMRMFNEVMEDDNTTAQKSTKETQAQGCSHNLPVIR